MKAPAKLIILRHALFVLPRYFEIEMKLFNILKATFVQGQFKVMFEKIWLRFFDKEGLISDRDNVTWLIDNETTISDFCSGLDKKLWLEIQEDVNRVSNSAKKTLENIPYDLGGGGAYPLLYFIVRFSKPRVVVETGVAAGFSTYAILDALNKNQKGHLHSSDFPYFRLPNPTQFIGIVVPDYLKKRWSLYTKGDHFNLKMISKCVNDIKIFHYDSDKSYKGRSSAFSVLRNHLSSKTWVIIDDIQDNSFFYDLVSKKPHENWRVFRFEGKWVGLLIPH